jgi:pSer/pThr/pTyr-binding forkhead associated (FHA) protein
LALDVALTGERVMIGRLKACDICLSDANASRQHAALERDGDGWTLVDMGSTNGTLVNGERTDRTRLHNGDIITIDLRAGLSRAES